MKKIPLFRVASWGNGQAKLAIIGEGPGETENRRGEPFVGVSGTLMRKCIIDLGYRPVDFWLCNIWKYRPPNNKYTKASETNNIEESEAIAQLIQELKNVKPNCLLLLGNNVLQALTEYKGITEYRGSIMNTKVGIKAVATFHPAGLLQMAQTLSLIHI